MKRLVELDIGAEKNLLDHDTHCFEPKIELTLLEEFLLTSITSSLEELEEGLADSKKIFKVSSTQLVEDSEGIAVLGEYVQAQVDLVVGDGLLD